DAPLRDLDPAAFARGFAEPELSTIPRIMLAARPKLGAAATAEAQGWTAYLPKPVRSTVLLAAVSVTTPEPGERPPGDGERHSIAEALQMPSADGSIQKEFEDAVVLVADDVRVNQVVAKCMLESLGCSVEIVSNGLEAVSRVQRGGIDVVFMDMHMPELDG